MKILKYTIRGLSVFAVCYFVTVLCVAGVKYGNDPVNAYYLRLILLDSLTYVWVGALVVAAFLGAVRAVFWAWED